MAFAMRSCSARDAGVAAPGNGEGSAKVALAAVRGLIIGLPNAERIAVARSREKGRAQITCDVRESIPAGRAGSVIHRLARLALTLSRDTT
jgi:hypothetical protein